MSAEKDEHGVALSDPEDSSQRQPRPRLPVSCWMQLSQTDASVLLRIREGDFQI